MEAGCRKLTTTSALLNHWLLGEDMGNPWVFHKTQPDMLALQMPRDGTIEKGYVRIFPDQYLTVPLISGRLDGARKGPPGNKVCLPFVLSLHRAAFP
jgi:hypothetical protein